MYSFTEAFVNYFNFSGRSSRKDYWTFFVWNTIIYFCIAAISMYLNEMARSRLFMILPIIWGLGTIIPFISVSVRRLHDTDRSGYWSLLYLSIFLLPATLILFFKNYRMLYLAIFLIVICYSFLLWFFLESGDQGKNSYGEDPLDTDY